MCRVALKNRYRLRGSSGNATQIGKILECLLEESLSEIAVALVCRKCRLSLLRLEKLHNDFIQLKRTLKASLHSQRSNQEPPQAQHMPVAAAVRLRSPSAQSTGMSPAEKRAAIRSPCLHGFTRTARKELFPLNQPVAVAHGRSDVVASEETQATVQQVSISVPAHPKLSATTTHALVVTPPRKLSGSPISGIPVPAATSLGCPVPVKVKCGLGWKDWNFTLQSIFGNTIKLSIMFMCLFSVLMIL